VFINDTSTDSREERLVRRLLGRRPKISFRIIRRCPDGCPQVLETPPLLRENDRWLPFPTIYWLTCPRLKLELSRLEQAGYVKLFGNKAKDQEAVWQAYQAGQEAIGVHRVESARTLLGKEPEPELVNILAHTTIAGSHHLAGVKCLHAHVAHTLAGGVNPIGGWALEMAGACRPDVSCLSFLKPAQKEEQP
jgi:hypothetical protein